MFCPPAVREKYTKKYGKKRVEEYERRMLARQQKQQQQQKQRQEAGITTTEEKGKKVPSISKFLRKRRSKKTDSKIANAKLPNDDDMNKTTNIPNNSNSNTRRWTTNDSKALLELGENGKTFIFEEDEEDDENHLDAEFGAYASGSSVSSSDTGDDDNDSNDSAVEDNKSNDEEILYQDSSEDDDFSDGNNRNHKSKRNIWSLPNDEALKQLERNFEMGASNSSRRSEIVAPASPKKDSNVFGIFVNAFQGMNFFHDKKNNTNDVTNEDITAVSPEEQQKRANELLAALGMFGVTSPTDPKTTTYLPAIPDLEVTETSAASDRITSSNNEKDEIEEIKISETQKNIDLSTPLSRFEEYYGGTYDDNDSAADVDDDDGYDDDESTEEDESKDEYHDTHTTELVLNDSDHLRQPLSTSSKSHLDNVTSAKKEKSILNMDIAVLAHTFDVSRNILNEDCEPSPSQKRMLISHFAQLRRKKTTKQQERMRQKLNEDDDDEVMDLDDSDDDDERNNDSDDSEEEERKRKKEAGTSGVDHVGADVFLATQRRTRYYGTSAGSLTYGSHHKQRRSCRSVTSLSNIDEDSVVESCDGDSIPMVNRLMLHGPGTLWQDNHGEVVAATNRPGNLMPDFKPRFEEDNDDVDSDDDDHEDDNHHTIFVDDEDAKTAVSSSSSSRVSPVATPLKMQGIASPNDVSDRSLNGSFCFGGILLATPSHFTPATSASENGEIYDSVSVITENSRKSTSTTKKTKQLSSPLASLVHPMNRELFDIPLEDRRNNDNERTEIREPKRPPVKLQTQTPSPKKVLVVRNDDYHIGPKSPAQTAKNDFATTPTVSTPTSKKPDNVSVLHSEQYTIVGKSPNSESRSRLSSSFRSSAMSPDGDRNRVTYSLGSGKKSMSKDERIRVQSLLPKRPFIVPEDSVTTILPSANTKGEESKREETSSSPKSPVFSLQESRKRLSLSGSSDHETPSEVIQRIASRQQKMRTIAVLLIEPTMKLFEVVFLEDINLREATVGDILAKARANAVDPALSEQKYNSLCNEDQELAAPMLPVDYLLKNDEDCATARPDENEAVLLVAVPVGYTAVEMQAIKTVLWKNPKTARWWDQKDPTRPTRQSKKKLDNGEETKEVDESKECEQGKFLSQAIEL